MRKRLHAGGAFNYAILPRAETMDLGGLNIKRVIALDDLIKISNCKHYQTPILLDRWLAGASCM